MLAAEIRVKPGLRPPPSVAIGLDADRGCKPPLQSLLACLIVAGSGSLIVAQHHRPAWMLQFDFRQDQTGVLPSKLVHLPEETVMDYLETRLLDQGMAAELEHLLCLLDGYLILELGSD